MNNIYNFRDKEIVHDSCFRKQDIIICISDNGMFLGYGLSYSKDTDNMKQSRAGDELIEELDKYVISIFEIIKDNKERIVLK
jgi:hypothetical protein